MTRKDYVAIAKILVGRKPKFVGESIRVWEMICFDLANYFDSQNQNFNRERFIKACNNLK